jgi:cell wall-associated NlpC family hydrolase
LVNFGKLLMRAAVTVMVSVLAALVFTVPASAATRPPPQAVAYAWAVAQHGKPFAWGARGPYAYDCSGLVQAAYRHAGIFLPRDTYGMVRSRQLKRISRAQVQRGDLAFYGPPGAPEHVALVDTGNVVFSAYRPGRPAGWSIDSRWWSPDAFFRVRARGGI